MAHRVFDLQQLSDLVTGRRSVYCPRVNGFTKPKPAAFIIQFSGAMLLRLLKSGMFVYEKKGR